MKINRKTLALTNFEFKVPKTQIDNFVEYELSIKGYLTKDVLELVRYLSCTEDLNETHLFVDPSFAKVEGESK